MMSRSKFFSQNIGQEMTVYIKPQNGEYSVATQFTMTESPFTLILPLEITSDERNLWSKQYSIYIQSADGWKSSVVESYITVNLNFGITTKSSRLQLKFISLD